MNLPTIQPGATRKLLAAAAATCALLAPLLARSSVQPAWIAHTNGGVAQTTNHVVAMALDGEGNIVIAGSSTGAAGDYDYLTLKYASDGHLLWSARYASTNNGNDQVQGMVLDGEGNAYLTGSSVTVKYRSDGSLAWTAPYAGRGLAANATRQLYVTGFSGADFATVKLSESGTNEWVRFKDFYGLNDRADKIVVDEEGGVLVAGAAVFQCSARPPACYLRLAVVKYDSNGSLLWSALFPGPMEIFQVGTIITLTQLNGYVYVLARIDLPFGASFYTVRLDSRGNVNWIQDFGIGPAEGASGMAVTPDGFTYVTGSKITFSGTGVSYVALEADPSGTEVWRRYYNNGGTTGPHRSTAMALDGAGNIYLTGYSSDSATNADWATVKYSPEGTELWVRRYHGPTPGIDSGQAIVVDAIGNIYVAGIQATTNGSIEVVLIKYSELTNIALRADGTAVLQFFGAPGQSSRIQGTTNLVRWTELGRQTVDDGGVVRFEDTNAAIFPTRFYRMVSP